MECLDVQSGELKHARVEPAKLVTAAVDWFSRARVSDTLYSRARVVRNGSTFRNTFDRVTALSAAAATEDDLFELHAVSNVEHPVDRLVGGEKQNHWAGGMCHANPCPKS